MKYGNTFLLFLFSKRHRRMGLSVSLVLALLLALKFFPIAAQTNGGSGRNANVISQNAEQMLVEGRQTFRFDTFGNEVFWGDTLKLHEAVAKLSPRQALALGLKVDADALPAELIEQIKRGEVDRDDPATTVLLLKLNAIVGLTGRFRPDGNIKSIGIQCALCHSTVDDAFRPSLGHRLDGWPNRDLNVGGIIASAPDLRVFEDLLGVPDEAIREVLNGWGPGKFDAELVLDGKAVRPDGKPAATLIPPAFGLAGVNNHTWTGSWGEPSLTGTPLSPTSRCTARGRSSTRASTMLRNIPSRPEKASVTSAMPRI